MSPYVPGLVRCVDVQITHGCTPSNQSDSWRACYFKPSAGRLYLCLTHVFWIAKHWLLLSWISAYFRYKYKLRRRNRKGAIYRYTVYALLSNRSPFVCILFFHEWFASCLVIGISYVVVFIWTARLNPTAKLGSVKNILYPTELFHRHTGTLSSRITI